MSPKGVALSPVSVYGDRAVDWVTADLRDKEGMCLSTTSTASDPAFTLYKPKPKGLPYNPTAVSPQNTQPWKRRTT